MTICFLRLSHVKSENQRKTKLADINCLNNWNSMEALCHIKINNGIQLNLYRERSDSSYIPVMKLKDGLMRNYLDCLLEILLSWAAPNSFQESSTEVHKWSLLYLHTWLHSFLNKAFYICMHGYIFIPCSEQYFGTSLFQ